jgi:hypothetical protein
MKTTGGTGQVLVTERAVVMISPNWTIDEIKLEWILDSLYLIVNLVIILMRWRK